MLFAGNGKPIGAKGFGDALAAIEVEDTALWSVLTVETSGCGFQPDRRPKILFERHIFSRLTHGAHDAEHPDVSAPTPGGYGQSGAFQYERLAVALSLDETAALKSASWGMGQVLGTNFAAAGFDDVKAMVDAFVQGEDQQLSGMAAFIRSNSSMRQALADKDWRLFARLYNGPNYAANNYDGHLNAFCAQYTSRGVPNVDVRSAQVYLNYLGYNTGGIDGVDGKITTEALKKYQSDNGLPVSGLADRATLDHLSADQN